MIPKWRDLFTSPPSRPMWANRRVLSARASKRRRWEQRSEAGVKNDFAQDLTPTERSILFAAQAPTAAGALGQNVSIASWKAKPSWYLVATADRAIQPSLERAMAKTINAKTVEIASSHVAMLARPEETASLILEAAARASRSNVELKSA
jgi:pimeloyl-ACP methyl ester carboxylesterase